MPRNYDPAYESMKAYTPNFQGVVDAIAELGVCVAGTETVPGRESTNQQLDSLNNTAESIDQQMQSVVTAVNTNTSKVELMTTAVQAVEVDVEGIAVDVDTLTAMQSVIVSKLTLMEPDLDNINTKVNLIEVDTDTLVAIGGTIRDRLPTKLASPTDYLTTRLSNGTTYYSDTNALPVSIPGGISIGEVTVKNTPLPVTLQGGNNVSLTGGTISIDSITQPVSLSGGTVAVSAIAQPVSLSGGSVSIANSVKLDTTTPPDVNVVNIPHVIVDSGVLTSVGTIDTIKGGVISRLDSLTAGTLNTVQTIDTLKGGILTRVDSLAGGVINRLDSLAGGIVTRVDTLAGGRITQVDTILGGIISRVDSITAIGFVDVTPSLPAATDYLPVRLTNATDWLGSDTLPIADRTAINTAQSITITSGNTTSSAFSINGQNSIIHLPPASPTRTVFLQVLGWDGSTWVDAFSQATNTTLGTFIKSSDLAGTVSGATGEGKNNFRLRIDSSFGSNLTFRIESRG